VLEHAHLQFSLTAPRPGWLSYDRLFELMDHLDPDVRDDLLTDLYITYEVPGDGPVEDGKGPDLPPSYRYGEFKKIFPTANSECNDQNIVVFGLVSYLLAEAARKSDIARFDTSMSGHQMVLSVVRQELRKEELPASELIKRSREVMDQIESLHRELAVSRKAYRAFCEKVVTPLVTKR
jgi:hypothetical protein